MLLRSDLCFGCTPSRSVPIWRLEMSVLHYSHTCSPCQSFSQSYPLRLPTMSGNFYHYVSPLHNLQSLLLTVPSREHERGNPTGLPCIVGRSEKKSCCNFNHPNIASFIINEGWTKLQPSRKSNGVESVGSLGRWGSGALPVQRPAMTKQEMGDLREEEVLSLLPFEFSIVWLLSCRGTVEIVTGEAGSGWPSQRRQKEAAECDQNETKLSEGYQPTFYWKYCYLPIKMTLSLSRSLSHTQGLSLRCRLTSLWFAAQWNLWLF